MEEEAGSSGWRFSLSFFLSVAAGLFIAKRLFFPPLSLPATRGASSTSADEDDETGAGISTSGGATTPGASTTTTGWLYETLTSLTLNYPSSSSSGVEWEFENPARVGRTVSFRIALCNYRGTPFPIDETTIRDWVSIEIMANETRVLHTSSFCTSPTPTSTPTPTPMPTPASTPVEAASESSMDSFDIRPPPSKREELPINVVRVSFTVHTAATYDIRVKIRNSHVNGSPFRRVFKPGPLDLVKTTLCQQSPLLICGQGSSLEFAIQPRDKYNNKCDLEDIDGSLLSLSASPVATNLPPDQAVEVFPVHSVFERNSKKINITAYPDKTGIFRVTLTYLLKPVANCAFHLIVLTAEDVVTLEANVSKKKHNLWYEAHILDPSNRKPRKVYVYVSPRQITIKEFYLKFIPKRLFTCRVCPSTRIDFKLSEQYSNPQIFSIDDGCVDIDLVCKDRDMLIATYARFLLKNIGGSETFQDKRDFFNAELLKHHKLRGRGRLSLVVSRHPDLFASAYKALKSATTSDWCKLFEFSFAGEEGLDYGGLRREAFNQIFKIIFQNESGLFKRFSEERDGSVHPSPANVRSPDLKTKYFEFAGKLVGKCLFESAQGLTYALNVNARFSRSFLAQLIGLRVNFKYFEQDDPQFYVSKVKYILENNLDDAISAAEAGLDDLTFSEEVYDERGQIVQVIEFIPNGSQVRVTNANKKKYLDCLAQHRFVNTVSAETDAFMKGLNELIPDSLLCIFDERELELLLCGTGKIDIDDFRANTKICSSSSLMFPRLVEWFWTIVSSFGQEELALLLQFVSGSSQLPPGGFSQLRPQFQITHSPAAYNSLPTAHTCFNQLCLPDYEDCATLHRMLLIALHEGSQGFGFQ